MGRLSKDQYFPADPEYPVLIAVLTPTATRTIEKRPDADACVFTGQSPYYNTGTWSQLYVRRGYGYSTDPIESYCRFNVSDATGSVQSAVLTLTPQFIYGNAGAMTLEANGTSLMTIGLYVAAESPIGSMDVTAVLEHIAQLPHRRTFDQYPAQNEPDLIHTYGRELPNLDALRVSEVSVVQRLDPSSHSVLH